MAWQKIWQFSDTDELINAWFRVHSPRKRAVGDQKQTASPLGTEQQADLVEVAVATTRTRVAGTPARVIHNSRNTLQTAAVKDNCIRVMDTLTAMNERPPKLGTSSVTVVYLRGDNRNVVTRCKSDAVPHSVRWS